jgi:hypothetical protein
MSLLLDRVGVRREFTFNVDYFDYAAGAGYKKYYPAIGKDSTGYVYFLTDNSSLASATDKCFLQGASDIDFDLTFNTPMTIAAADAHVSYFVVKNGADGDSTTTTINVYHVSTAAVETLIGTIAAADTDGNPVTYVKKTMKIALTKKHFSIGEKLRINVVIALLNGSAAWKWHFDPAGLYSQTDVEGRTINNSASINLPFKIDM